MTTEANTPNARENEANAANAYRVPKVIHDQGERPLELFSCVEGPVESLSFLQRALLFAEFSMIAYNDEAEASKAAAAMGFPRSSYLNHDGSQAYCFRNDHDCVLVCRGTEMSEWNDIRADVNVGTVLVGTFGRVHRGFNREVDDIWPSWEKELKDNEMPVYFCGHSLGGAMATICAARCKMSPIKSNPKELFTFGSPRVGCKKYISSFELSYYRFVNNNDIVTRIPPVWLGYQHSGHEVYFNRNGDIAKYGYVMKRRDRWRGFLKSLMSWKLDHLSDHSIEHYCSHLLKAVREELDKTGRK
jgi:triacylglycerol lipase